MSDKSKKSPSDQIVALGWDLDFSKIHKSFFSVEDLIVVGEDIQKAFASNYTIRENSTPREMKGSDIPPFMKKYYPRSDHE